MYSRIEGSFSGRHRSAQVCAGREGRDRKGEATSVRDTSANGICLFVPSLLESGCVRHECSNEAGAGGGHGLTSLSVCTGAQVT